MNSCDIAKYILDRAVEITQRQPCAKPWHTCSARAIDWERDQFVTIEDAYRYLQVAKASGSDRLCNEVLDSAIDSFARISERKGCLSISQREGRASCYDYCRDTFCPQLYAEIRNMDRRTKTSRSPSLVDIIRE